MAKPSVTSTAELQNKSSFDHIEILVPHEEDEPLNCELVDGNTGVVMINKVSPDSILHGKVQSGDYVLSVNGKVFQNRTDIFNLASRAYPQMKLIVARVKSQASPSPSPAAPTPSPAAPTQAVTKPQEVSEKGSESSEGSKSESEPSKSDTSTKALDPRKLAASKGFNVRPDREYLIWRAKTTNTGKSLGLGIMRIAKDNSVLVSSVQPNTVSSDLFKAGDRFLVINNTVISDVQICKKLILETKGDFDALIERPPNGLEAYGIQKAPPLKCSYTQPVKSDPDQQLGNPQDGYEAAPIDVQTILNRQLPLLMKHFGVGSQRSSQRERVIQNSDRLKIEHDVHEQHIESDVPHGSVLRKPPKRT